MSKKAYIALSGILISACSSLSLPNEASEKTHPITGSPKNNLRINSESSLPQPGFPADGPVKPPTYPPSGRPEHLVQQKASFEPQIGTYHIQTSSEIDELLKDGTPHSISICFQDRFKFRAISDKSNKTDIINQDSTATKTLSSILSKYEIGKISSEFINITPEQESLLSIQEAELEKNSSVDLPNRASIISIELDKYTPEKLKNLVLELQKLPFVRTAHVPCPMSLEASNYRQPPSDPGFPSVNWAQNDYQNNEDLDSLSQPYGIYWWNRHSTGVAWDEDIYKGQGIKVAVIDSSFGIQSSGNDGITYDTSLSKRFYGASNSQTTDVEPEYTDTADNYQHGTSVASLLAARDGNYPSGSQTHFCGIAPNATIIPIRVGSPTTSANTLNIEQAIYYAVNNGAKVINISQLPTLGSRNPDSEAALKRGNDYAWQAGVTVVYAAGNQNQPSDIGSTPHSGAIVVGGVDKNNDPAANSNFGTRVDMAAASVDVATSSLER